MPASLTIDDVRHIASLARLRLDDDQLARYREELSTILDHMIKLQEVNIEEVEPLTHPVRYANRFAEDVAGQTLAANRVLKAAPDHEGAYIAVPKVIGGGA